MNKTTMVTGRPIDVMNSIILLLIGLVLFKSDEIKISTIGAINKRVTVSIKPVTINIITLRIKRRGNSLRIYRKKINAFILSNYFVILYSKSAKLKFKVLNYILVELIR